MKRVSALALSLLVFAVWPAMAGQGRSGDKATGTVTYPNAGDISTIVFDVHEAIGNRPAKGMLQYYELDPVANITYHYSLDITCVNVDPATHTATFAGTVFDSNLPGLDNGVTIQAWVYDGGTPGSKGDKVAGNVVAVPDCTVLDPTAFGNPWIDVTEGNLTVHASK